MHAFDCACGRHLIAYDTTTLFHLLQAHVFVAHYDLDLSDDNLRAEIAENSYPTFLSTKLPPRDGHLWFGTPISSL